MIALDIERPPWDAVPRLTFRGEIPDRDNAVLGIVEIFYGPTHGIEEWKWL